MNGKELLKRLRKHKVIGPDFHTERNRGKGGHVMAHYKSRKASISPNKEFSKGVIKEFLKQLGIDPKGIV